MLGNLYIYLCLCYVSIFRFREYFENSQYTVNEERQTCSYRLRGSVQDLQVEAESHRRMAGVSNVHLIYCKATAVESGKEYILRDRHCVYPDTYEKKY